MRKRHIPVAALLILAVIFMTSGIALASPNISSPKAVLIDADTGQVLYDKNAHVKAYPASTTKIMTAILALERGNLEDYVPISKKASYVSGSRIYLLEGEKVTLEQLLYALLLESGNDAAIAIAEHIGGSVEEFAVMMNDKAKQLGALNTHFTNPNGLPDPNHVTTAYDLAQIARYAMTIPAFKKIVDTTRYIMPETNMQDTRYLYNGNKLIKNTSYSYEGANGVKTGYTTAAGHCFVGSASKNGLQLITVILGENNSNRMWENTIKLLDYGFDNYKSVPLNKAGEVIREADVKGSSRKIKLVTEKAFHYDVLKGQSPEIERRTVLDGEIKAPVHPGERLGFLEYRIGEDVIGKIRLIADDTNQVQVMLSSIFSSKGDNNTLPYIWPVLLLVSAASVYIVLRQKRNKSKYFFRK